MQPLSLGASLPDIQDYVRRMETLMSILNRPPGRAA